MAQDETGSPARRTPRQFPRFTIRDGRYLGTNGRWWVEVRVDADGSGVISADLHTTGASGTLTQVSARTLGNAVDARAGRWSLSWREGEHERSGWLAARPAPDVSDGYTLTFGLTRTHEDSAGDTIVAARVTRVSDALRDLGLEIEVEQGVVGPRPITFDGGRMDTEEYLRRAGFAVHSIGESSSVARPQGDKGWSGVNILETLNKQLVRAAQGSLAVPAWEAHLLLLSKSDRPGLLGVMFDFVDDLPRQGAAVFVDEIRGRYPEDADRRILSSIVHELGHVLNLTHRFAVGHADSLSPMNYDWAYRGGRRSDEFRRHFQWELDPDELEFVRHGRRDAVVPGGSAFGSDRYWLPEAAKHDQPIRSAGQLRLWLTPPGHRTGEMFRTTHGEPLFLEVSLANIGGDPVVVPRTALDVKAGQLELSVRHMSDGSPKPFAPMLHRCYDVDNPRLVRLGPGQSVHDNINLTFGSAGYPFGGEGHYEIVPTLLLPSADPKHPGEVVRVEGRPLEILVAAPPKGQASDAQTLGLPAVGVSLAMGGFSGRGDAPQALAELRDRRSRTHGDSPDPVVAAIDRVQGIEEGRKGNHAQAAKLLTDSIAQGGAVFDPHTVEHTRRLAARYRDTDQAVDRVTPTIVVDLGFHSRAGTVERAQVAGSLYVKPGTDQGCAVLAPADALPHSAMSKGEMVCADVTFTDSRGLTERLPAQRVDLVGGDDGQPRLALLWLPRPLPGTQSPRFDTNKTDTKITTDRSLWQILQDSGVTPPGLDQHESESLTDWASAASSALNQLSETMAPPPADVHASKETLFDDVAAWVCRLTPICDQAEPESEDSACRSAAEYPYGEPGRPPTTAS